MHEAHDPYTLSTRWQSTSRAVYKPLPPEQHILITLPRALCSLEISSSRPKQRVQSANDFAHRLKPSEVVAPSMGSPHRQATTLGHSAKP